MGSLGFASLYHEMPWAPLLWGGDGEKEKGKKGSMNKTKIKKRNESHSNKHTFTKCEGLGPFGTCLLKVFFKAICTPPWGAGDESPAQIRKELRSDGDLRNAN